MFVAFASIHHYGIILDVDVDSNPKKAEYMVRFLDGDVRDCLFEGRDIKLSMRPNAKCWVPDNISVKNVTYEWLKKRKLKHSFKVQLEEDFIDYSNGDLDF